MLLWSIILKWGDRTNGHKVEILQEGIRFLTLPFLFHVQEISSVLWRLKVCKEREKGNEHINDKFKLLCVQQCQ